MKKLILCLLCSLQMQSAVPSSASHGCLGWYCAHVPDGKQPTASPELAFIEELDGYYLDHDGEKVIYLTFDAGYENGNIAKVLDVLREEDVKATFFVLAHLIKEEPELIRRMAEEGHTVGNHTVHHKDMSTFGEPEFLAELKALEDLYRETIGGELSHYYRPPEGRFSRENLEVASASGYKTIFWSFAYPDWSNEKQMPCEKALKIVLDNLHSGEVMLLHPTSSTNAAILRDIIREARARGYRFGTMDELTA